MGHRCTAAPRRVFSLFYFCDTKTQKITKNARDLLYLCVINFFHEQKQTQFFKKKIFGLNRYSYTLNQNRHERFSSRKKNEKKRAKNTFPVYGWASKSLKNGAFFMQNHHHVLLEKSLLLSFLGIQTELKK